jgi:hypothetical protein
MTSRERMIAALTGTGPDRLPVSTHHVMSSFLTRYLGGASTEEFFERFGLDPIRWVNENAADASRGEYLDPDHQGAFLEPRRVASDRWKVTTESVPDPQYPTVRYTFHTPRRNLTMVLQSDEHTSWVTERLIKDKGDIEVLADCMTLPLCDVAAVNRIAQKEADRSLLRGTVLCFDVYGQPGCWQDAAVLYGIENLILASYDDPEWVHAFLTILRERKLRFAESTAGARFDLIEFGGGDASSTVISPQIFESFVAPYDAPVIEALHRAGQRVVYHTCGGMMPLLEMIASMKPDAMETFTPPSMGGDTDLAEARRRLGDDVCMIGGFDQFHYFAGCSPEETRAAVRRCFDAAGEGGRYILAPSDHFFEAEPDLIAAYAAEARACVYG